MFKVGQTVAVFRVVINTDFKAPLCHNLAAQKELGGVGERGIVTKVGTSRITVSSGTGSIVGYATQPKNVNHNFNLIVAV